MAFNLKKVSKVAEGELPWTKATLYKLHHVKRYPGLFVKLGGSLFVDLDVLDRLVQTNRRE